jgi:hypothetical protein
LESRDWEFKKGNEKRRIAPASFPCVPGESRSAAPTGKRTETLVAKRKSESLAGTERLMEEARIPEFPTKALCL